MTPQEPDDLCHPEDPRRPQMAFRARPALRSGRAAGRADEGAAYLPKKGKAPLRPGRLPRPGSDPTPGRPVVGSEVGMQAERSSLGVVPADTAEVIELMQA